MNALITRTHINSGLDICDMGISRTPDKLKFTIETDENEEFGFGVEFEVGYTDEECDEIDWSTLDVFADNQTLERLKKFLSVFESELEQDFKKIDIKDVDYVLIVWDILHKQSFFNVWVGSEYEKHEFAKKLGTEIKNKDLAELAQDKYFVCGCISLSLLIELDKAKTKIYERRY